jgi:hypothetical protein
MKNLIGSGAPSSNDPKFERRPPESPWPTFHKSNEAKLFLIGILKALIILVTFRSGLVGLNNNIYTPLFTFHIWNMREVG